MKHKEIKELFQALFKTVYRSGEFARTFHKNLFNQNLVRLNHKSDGTPVTEVDIKINHLMAEFAQSHGLSFIGEEGNLETDSQYVLLVDPIDGTGAFRRGMNTSTIVASVLKMDGNYGRPVVAIIHEPLGRHTWYTFNRTTNYQRGGGWPAKSVYTINNAPKPWYSTVCAWPGAGYNMTLVKNLVRESASFQEQSMGAIGICGGLLASGILSLVAFPPGSAVETVAMQLIVDRAGGYTCDLLGEPLGQYELGELRGKQDFLLPNGAIFAADKNMADAFLAIVQEANT